MEYINISHVLAFITGVATLYFTAYIKAKGSNKALKEDIVSLESAKQKIIAEHAVELENIKKDHSLDVEKRKYQYESKKDQFIKFFQLIDEFNGKSHEMFQERFPPIMDRLLEGCLSEEQAVRNESTLVFNQEIMLIFNDLHKEQIKINAESNSIRLIASCEIDELLDQLEMSVRQATEDAVEMLRFMGTADYFVNKQLLEPYQTKLNKIGLEVLECRNTLKNQMKSELSEI